MFTLEQIKTAHSKVKSGADFPAYIKDLKQLGVSHYETFVNDGHTDYYDHNTSKLVSPARYQALNVANVSNPEKFKADLKAHQDGQTDYPTFCSDCVQSGIEKWKVSITNRTCTYFDKSENVILVEEIPG